MMEPTDIVTLDIVKVEWIDSGARMGDTWAPLQRLIDEASANNGAAVSVGFLLHEDERYLLLAQSHDTHFGGYINTMQIMKSNVQKVTRL